MTSLKEFKSSMRICDDLQAVFSAVDFEPRAQGLVYRIDGQSYWIESTENWTEEDRAAGRWFTMANNIPFQSDCLEDVEEFLYFKTMDLIYNHYTLSGEDASYFKTIIVNSERRMASLKIKYRDLSGEPWYRNLKVAHRTP